MCQVKHVLTDQRIGGAMLAQSRTPDIVLQMESENPTDKVFTGWEVSPRDDSRVSAQNAIYETPASTQTRPTGHPPMPSLTRFCQLCCADSCLIAAHHFWGLLQEERNQCSACFNPRRRKVSVSYLACFCGAVWRKHDSGNLNSWFNRILIQPWNIF